MSRGALRTARSGLDSYDAARWRDWVPDIDCVHRQGPLGTLRQIVPSNAHRSNETTVPANTFNVLIFHLGKPRRVISRVNGAAFDHMIGNGTATFLPAGVDSWWLSTPAAAHNVVHLHLDDGFCRSLYEQDGLNIALAQQSTIADPLLTATAQMLVESLTGSLPPTRLFWETAATSVALRLAHLSQRHKIPHVAPVGCDWRIRRSLEEIEARLAEDSGLVELAAAVGLSPSHYATLFRQATGMPPHAWLMKRRVERACEMVLNPSASVTEIAFALGFPSSQHFATVFRKHMGVTPTDWRRSKLG